MQDLWKYYSTDIKNLPSNMYVEIYEDSKGKRIFHHAYTSERFRSKSKMIENRYEDKPETKE